jgi:hypothetical protein
VGSLVSGKTATNYSASTKPELSKSITGMLQPNKMEQVMFLERAFTKNYKVNGLYSGYAMSPYFAFTDLFGVKLEVEGIGTNVKETRAYRRAGFQNGSKVRALRKDTLRHDLVVILGSTVSAKAAYLSCKRLLKRVCAEGVFIGQKENGDPVFERARFEQKDEFEYSCDYHEGKVHGTYAAYAISADEMKYALCDVSVERNDYDEFDGSFSDAYRRSVVKNSNEMSALRPDTLQNDVVLLIGSSASADYVARSLSGLLYKLQEEGMFIGKDVEQYPVFEHLDGSEEIHRPSSDMSTWRDGSIRPYDLRS